MQITDFEQIHEFSTYVGTGRYLAEVRAEAEVEDWLWAIEHRLAVHADTWLAGELVPGIRALLTAAETDSALRREIVARGAVAFALGFLLSEAAQKPAHEL